MDILKSKQLREQRAKLIADAREALKGDNITAEVRAKVEAMDKDIEALEKDIELHERQEARERELATAPGKKPVTEGEGDEEARKASNEEKVKKYTAAFNSYVRHGLEGMDAEQRAILKQGYKPDSETRAQGVASTGAGGFTVPQGFMAELERAQKAWGGFSDQCRHLVTDAGSALPWPTVDDTSNSGVDIAENTAPAAQDVTFTSVTLNAYKMSTGIVLVSTELFEDTGLDINAELASIMGERIGRRKNNKYTLGGGSTTFTGAVTALTTNANVVTAASATVIAADELFDIQHAIDPAYRNNPKVGWVMHDSVKKAIRKLKDLQNRYLFEPSLVAGAPDTLLGKPIVINQDMSSAFTTGQKLIMYGDWNKFVIRDVRGLVIRRLVERYADADQIGFIGFYRGDSNLVTVAGSKAVVYYKLA